MCVGNDTSHARQTDFSERNRGLPCVRSRWKKWLGHFFDSQKRPAFAGRFFFYFWATLESMSALSTQKKVNSPVAMSLPPSPVMSTAVSTVDLPR